MPILELHLANLRCIEDLSLAPDRGWNWLIGPNGAGKSSILEGIHVLGTGNTWRNQGRSLLREGTDTLTLFARLLRNGMEERLGLQRQGDAREIRHNGKDVDSAWTLLGILPLQLLSDENIHFVQEGPEERRRILDWGVFHDEPEFGTVARDYRRTLRQRNAWLKEGRNRAPWDEVQAPLGERLQSLRQHHLDRITPLARAQLARWSGTLAEGLQWELQPGWEKGVPLAECLIRDRQRDRDRGFTHSGPHRAELCLRYRGRLAAEILSRGQIKVLGLALRLAQLERLWADRGLAPCLLIDDFSAELDRNARAWLMEGLRSLPVQVFAAVTELGEIPGKTAGQCFHLREGRLARAEVLAA